GIREWLSYSPERTHGRSVALVAGIAARKDSGNGAGRLFSMLRPIGVASWPLGHFHAAAFPYRPLKEGILDLRTIVRALVEGGAVRRRRSAKCDAFDQRHA